VRGNTLGINTMNQFPAGLWVQELSGIPNDLKFMCWVESEWKWTFSNSRAVRT